MTYVNLDESSLDYFMCRYGTSKLLFRGPRRKLSGDYVTFVGGIETYGKFVEMPFPAVMECETGIKSVNLGCINAGIDAFGTDKSLVDICAKSKVTVIQVMGAHNMSNRFYAVHSRRNDRFLRASSLLQSMFPEVDFTEFNFTRHLLTSLAKAAPEKFAMVESHLKTTWAARMNSMIDRIEGNVVLLWMAGHSPDDCPGLAAPENDPLFVDRAMIDGLSSKVSATVEVVGTPQERQAGMEELVFAPLERPAAEKLLGPVVHRRAAGELASVIGGLIG